MKHRERVARTYWSGFWAIVLLICTESALLAQTFPPVQRTAEEEKEFRERQHRLNEAESALEACMDKEVERDFAMKYMSVPGTVNAAMNSCSTLLERYAFIDCASTYTDGEKYCLRPEMRAASVEVRRQQQLENWVPILLRRRVELQPDGPKYLYDFASRFVYAVVAKNEKDNTTLQGSAVAVDDRYLATNCHVIEKATSINIYSGQAHFGASRSGLPVGEGGSDRCLLYADEQLPAFAAVREWRDVSVGERIYALGVPQGFALGFSLTLSDGILSGKRTDEKHRLIQSTAPISQGSSGGGLFDSSGRLVGITTFALTNGQNLNFAIAAEDWHYELCEAKSSFWGPTPDCTRYKPLP
ncbi:MAG: serine protease [Rhodomicrobium sp.]